MPLVFEPDRDFFSGVLSPFQRVSNLVGDRQTTHFDDRGGEAVRRV